MEFGTDVLGIRFLIGDLSLMVPYAATYSMPLVALSYVFAFAGSFAGLTVSQQISTAKSRPERVFWLFVGAAAMGGAVWSMHFIGMLAYQLPVKVGYETTTTMLSAIPSIGASMVVLWLLSHKALTKTLIVFGGVITGAGIGAMHFIGMDAIRANASMGYDPKLFALSVIVAVVLAIVALSTKAAIEKYSKHIGYLRASFFAAGIMAMAISGMHYTAMTAATFYEGSLCARGGPTIDGDGLSLIGFNIMFAFILVVLVGAIARANSVKSALLCAIMDNSLEGIVVTNSRGIVTLFSPAAERLFGYDAGEVLDQNVSMLIPEALRARHDQLMADIARDSSRIIPGKTRDVSGRRKDGTHFPVEIAIAKLPLGRETMYSATIRDISPRKELERAKEKAFDELTNTLEHQKALNGLQRQFISMASHEFRTPLTVIDSSAQFLARKIDNITTDFVLSKAAKIRESVARMTKLMESTLTAARMEEGKVSVDIKACDIAAVIRKVCDRQQDISKQHVISCQLTSLPAVIQADAGSLEQVFTNLLSNAVKYAPNASKVEVTARAHGERVVVSVRDFGIGIDEDDLEKIGERFFRAKTSTGIAGTGIGLNLVKMLVELHGGSLSVESRKGEGSTFMVTLPIAGPGGAEETGIKAA